MKEILFFDETENFIKTKEFASAVRFCDNYIVLVTREDIKCLSYSIKAVQQIVCTKSGKYYVNELKEYFKRNTLNNYFSLNSKMKSLKGAERPQKRRLHAWEMRRG